MYCVANIFDYDEHFYLQRPYYALLDGNELFGLIDQARQFLRENHMQGWVVEVKKALDNSFVINEEHFEALENVDFVEISEKKYQELLSLKNDAFFIRLEMDNPNFYCMKVVHYPTREEIGEVIQVFEEEEQ